MLVALVTFGAVCHAQMPRRVASDVKSCETQFAICQALLGTVGGKEARDVVHLAAITLFTESTGARSHVWPSRARDCMLTDGPRRAGTSAHVGTNTSGTLPPVETTRHPESKATSCAALLRECRAHGSARRRSTGGGEPLASPTMHMNKYLQLYLRTLTTIDGDISIDQFVLKNI